MSNIQHQVSLLPLNTLAVAAAAEHYVRVKTVHELAEVLSTHYDPLLVLGGGSNILLARSLVPGLVLHMDIHGIEVVSETGDRVIVRAMAGENWHDFVLWCVGQDYGGLENLSLIPGTVGAAPIQNIGAYGVELKDILHKVEAVHRRDGKIHVFTRDECRFSYRDSVFKDAESDHWVIQSVSFELSRGDHAMNLEYGAIRETLEAQGIVTPTIRDVSDAVISIRQARLPDPRQLPNAGSFFKNPVITKTSYQQLRQKYADIPCHIFDDGHVKVPAGWLIEQCGWKGRRMGRCAVHSQHALVLVNDQGADGEEILALAKSIQQDVKKRFGLTLIFEVNVLNDA